MNNFYTVFDAPPLSAAWREKREGMLTGTGVAPVSTKETIQVVLPYATKKGLCLQTNLIESVGLNDSTDVFGKTMWKIYAENNGLIPRFEGNDATRHGQKYEPLVRSYAESQLGIIFEAEVTAISKEHPFLMASLDALGKCPINPDEEIIGEIKTPQFNSRQKFWHFKKESKNWVKMIDCLSLLPKIQRESTLTAINHFLALEKKGTWLLWSEYPQLKIMLLEFKDKLENTPEELSSELLAQAPELKNKKLFELKRKQALSSTTVRANRIKALESMGDVDFIIEHLTESYLKACGSRSIHETNLPKKLEAYLSLFTYDSVKLLNRSPDMAINANLGYLLQMWLQMYVTGAKYGYFIMAGVEEKDEEPCIVYPIIEKVVRPSDEFYAQWIPYLKFVHETFYQSDEAPPMLPADHLFVEQARKASESALKVGLAASTDGELSKEGAEELCAEFQASLEEEAKATARRKDLEKRIKAAADKLRVEGVDTVSIGDASGAHLQIITKTSRSVSWAEFAKAAQKLIDGEVYKELVDKNTKEAEKVTIKLVAGS